jgi:hypothetical protein
MPTSAEVSQWKELARLPITESHSRDIERPNTHLGGVEVTKLMTGWQGTCSLYSAREGWFSQEGPPGVRLTD